VADESSEEEMEGKIRAVKITLQSTSLHIYQSFRDKALGIRKKRKRMMMVVMA
jgi:hypothetical protein